MSKDRRLGRGLAALLGSEADGLSAEAPVAEESGAAEMHYTPEEVRSQPAAEPPPKEQPEGGIVLVNVYEIDSNPFQPRREFDAAELDALAASLQEHDMLQPVLVRSVGDRYQLISGERRWRAAIQAGWTMVPAQVRPVDDRQAAEMAIVENLQRKDLNPIEKAQSFKRYLDQHDCTQEDLAGRLKIDRSTVSNLMRLLELPDAVFQAVQTGQLSAGHARALLPLGEERIQCEFAEQIGNEKWSVRETEQRVQERIANEDGQQLRVVGAANPPRSRKPNEQIVALEQELRMALGTRVEIRQGARGKGKLVVHFTSHEEFDRIRDLLTSGGATGRTDVG